MKISKTQSELLEKIKMDINKAREAKDFKNWYWSVSRLNASVTFENCIEKLEELNSLKYYKNRFEELKEGIALTQTSSSTLRALENKGLIEIIIDAGNGIDHVRLLNF